MDDYARWRLGPTRGRYRDMDRLFSRVAASGSLRNAESGDVRQRDVSSIAVCRGGQQRRPRALDPGRHPCVVHVNARPHRGEVTAPERASEVVRRPTRRFQLATTHHARLDLQQIRDYVFPHVASIGARGRATCTPKDQLWTTRPSDDCGRFEPPSGTDLPQ